jgi:hypothetical protein
MAERESFDVDRRAYGNRALTAWIATMTNTKVV